MRTKATHQSIMVVLFVTSAISQAASADIRRWPDLADRAGKPSLAKDRQRSEMMPERSCPARLSCRSPIFRRPHCTTPRDVEVHMAELRILEDGFEQRRRELGRQVAVADPGPTIVHANAAGIDVGNESHYVAVPPDRDPNPVREHLEGETLAGRLKKGHYRRTMRQQRSQG